MSFQNNRTAKHIRKSKFAKKTNKKKETIIYQKPNVSDYLKNILKVNSKNIFQIPTPNENFFSILEPNKNFALYPKELQKIINKEQYNKDIISEIDHLKSPLNQFSFKKKIAKLKLLGMGQITMIKTFLKEKYIQKQSISDFQHYLNFINQNQSLNKKFNNTNKFDQFSEEPKKFNLINQFSEESLLKTEDKSISNEHDSDDNKTLGKFMFNWDQFNKFNEGKNNSFLLGMKEDL